MDALDALHKRTSSPRLTEPAPGGLALENIFKAALRAPDHARLKPWRFLLVQGGALDELGNLFASVASADNPSLDATALDKLRAKPRRAPLVIVVAAKIQPHPKVPEIEQMLAAGAAAHAMLLAAHAQGFGGIWRTGPMAYSRAVHRGLGLRDQEKIIGFLYLGTRCAEARPPSDCDPLEFFENWHSASDPNTC